MTQPPTTSEIKSRIRVKMKHEVRLWQRNGCQNSKQMIGEAVAVVAMAGKCTPICLSIRQRVDLISKFWDTHDPVASNYSPSSSLFT